MIEGRAALNTCGALQHGPDIRVLKGWLPGSRACVWEWRGAGAQLDDRDTFLGVGTNRLVRWDQRAREGVVQDALSSPSVVGYAGGKDYARNTNFSCMATSGAAPRLPLVPRGCAHRLGLLAPTMSGASSHVL